jgi:hypothetical protein
VIETSVEYNRLGRAREGQQGTRFVREAGLDTLVISVSLKDGGGGTVLCGEYNLNHPGVSVFNRDWMPRLDSASKEHWHAALSEQAR